MALTNLSDLPDSVDNAVKNLTDKPTESVGKTFSDIWYLVFGGISYAADKRRMKYAHNLAQYHQKLESAVNQIPKEKRIEADIQVTAQALENSKYCIESEVLRSMFVNLIAKSMHSDYRTAAHPSFAEIIKQMSPDDARVLKTIAPKENIAIADFIIEESDRSSFSTILTNVYIPGLPDLDIHQNCAAITSLARLGLLQICIDSCVDDENAYWSLKETSFFKDLSNQTYRFHPEKKATLHKRLGRLTVLGENFVSICVQ